MPLSHNPFLPFRAGLLLFFLIRTLTPPLPLPLFLPLPPQPAIPQKWAPLCGHDVSRVLAKGLEGNDLDLALFDQVSE